MTRPRRRYRLGGADLSGHTTTSTTTAAAAAAAAAQADSSVFIYTPAAAASTTGTASAASATPASSSMSIISSISRDDSSGKATAREIAERAAERTEQIENCVGLSKGCRLCIRTANILAKHVEVCGVAACSVPYCSNLKQLRGQSHRTHSKLA